LTVKAAWVRTRRIDAAVAAAMAVHRAAELVAGAREPSIYIRAHYDPGERGSPGS
jgi:hypothetical protein